MANNTNTGSKKIYSGSDIVDLAQREYEAVDEQAILNKYNQATAAQFAAQQDQNRIAENNFYNQMYNTQRTAMDTIRQSNANAVSTGASRGVQAANELSALLGLQQESIASATEIANARRQTAQEETAAMLQNIVQASQDAAAQKQAAFQTMVQAQSVKQTEDQTASADINAAKSMAATLAQAAGKSPLAATNAVEAKAKGYNQTYSPEGEAMHTESLADMNRFLPGKYAFEADAIHGAGGTEVRTKLKTTSDDRYTYYTDAMGITDNYITQDVLSSLPANSLLYNTINANQDSIKTVKDIVNLAQSIAWTNFSANLGNYTLNAQTTAQIYNDLDKLMLNIYTNKNNAKLQ